MKAAGISRPDHRAADLASLLIAASPLPLPGDGVPRDGSPRLGAVDYGPIRAKPAPQTTSGCAQDDLIFAAVVSGRGETHRGCRTSTVYDGRGTLSDHRQERRARAMAGCSKRSSASTSPPPRSRGSHPAWPRRGSHRFTLARVDPAEQDLPTLKDSIDQMKAAGRATAALEAGLLAQDFRAALGVLMPLLGAVAAFGLARPASFPPRGDGMALGLRYFVADNFALAMGQSGRLPALLALGAVPALLPDRRNRAHPHEE
jgi:lipopolysaccharide export system permease protein